MLINVGFFGSSLQCVCVDTNAEISGGRAAGYGLGAGSDAGGGDWVRQSQRYCGLRGQGARVQTSAVLNLACLMLLDGMADPTGGATQVKERAACVQTKSLE